MKRGELSPELEAAFEDEWRRLASPGPTLTGAQRIAVAAAARDAREGEAPPDDPVHRAGATVSATPASIRQPWVSETAAEIGYPTYVEVVGVVARLSAVDTVHRGLGLRLLAFPQPVPGEPTREVDAAAHRSSTWVPTSGGASVVFALSLVPAEMDAQEIMSGPLYMTYEAMADPAHPGVITRAQKELVASRTSAINECFY